MLFKQLFDIFKKVYFFKGLWYNEGTDDKATFPCETRKAPQLALLGFNLLFDEL